MVNGCPRGSDCGGCQMYGGPTVCHCMQVTEDQLVEALTTMNIRSVRDVIRDANVKFAPLVADAGLGAGDGERQRVDWRIG